MKAYETSKLRNLALIGHGDTGKTTLVSALLFASGAVKRLGSVDDGSSTTDYDEEEIERLLWQVKVGGYRARSVLRSIVTSPSFLSK